MSDIVVIMVTGGPQTRYGSHRLFVNLARYLCQRGISVFRFDYEGMGDSDGSFVGYKLAAPSIQVAIEYLDSVFTSRTKQMIWSLCDGVSASLGYVAEFDNPVHGMILCNPLIHKELDLYRRHYYKQHFYTLDFWKRILLLNINFRKSIPEAIRTLCAHVAMKIKKDTIIHAYNLSETMKDGILSVILDGIIPIRFILSEEDVVAQEFKMTYLANSAIAKALQGKDVGVIMVEDADHTFSQPKAQKVLFEQTYRAILEMDNRYHHEG
jgi:exosortase A-associated hydrolase 1